MPCYSLVTDDRLSSDDCKCKPGSRLHRSTFTHIFGPAVDQRHHCTRNHFPSCFHCTIVSPATYTTLPFLKIVQRNWPRKKRLRLQQTRARRSNSPERVSPLHPPLTPCMRRVSCSSLSNWKMLSRLPDPGFFLRRRRGYPPHPCMILDLYWH